MRSHTAAGLARQAGRGEAGSGSESSKLDASSARCKSNFDLVVKLPPKIAVTCVILRAAIGCHSPADRLQRRCIVHLTEIGRFPCEVKPVSPSLVHHASSQF